MRFPLYLVTTTISQIYINWHFPKGGITNLIPPVSLHDDNFKQIYKNPSGNIILLVVVIGYVSAPSNTNNAVSMQTGVHLSEVLADM